MANRPTTKKEYLLGLEYFDQKAKSWWSKTRVHDEWLKFRKSQREQGIEVPNIKSVVKAAKQFKAQQQQLENEKAFSAQIDAALKDYNKQFDYENTTRNSDMRTETPSEPIDKASEAIDDFLSDVDKIYNDTIDYIDSMPEPSTWGKGRYGTAEGWFLSQHISDMEASYRRIHDLIAEMRQYGDEAVAAALASSKDLDYTRALVFIPPSDGVVNNFDVTVEMLEGIVQALANEASAT